MNKRKILFYTLLAVVVFATAYSFKTKALEVETQKALRKDFYVTTTENGKVVLSDALNIISEVSGKVAGLYCEAGDSVNKDRLLAKIDTTEINSEISGLQGELLSVSGAEEAVKQGTLANEIKEKEIYLKQQQTVLESARANYDRIAKLYAEGAASLVELENAKADLKMKEDAITQITASIAQLKTQQTNLLRQNEGNSKQYRGQKESIQAKLAFLNKQKSKHFITSLVKGVILTKNIKAGDYVTPGMTLFTVGKQENKLIETYVNSKDLVTLKEGDKAEIVFQVLGKDVKCEGIIAKISPVAEEITSALGLPEDKVKVKIRPVNLPEDIKLIPGMTADVILNLYQAKHVITVAKDAVFTDNGQDFVWVVESGKAVLRKVEKGIEGDETVEIKNGLKEGEIIISNPHLSGLKEGINIKEITL